jgi:hypothetical protein
MTQALNLIQRASASFQSVPVESFRRIWSMVVDVSTVKFQLPLDGAIFDDGGHVRIYNRGTPSEYKIWVNSMVISRKNPYKIEKMYDVGIR